jgi:hypothetical protein
LKVAHSKSQNVWAVSVLPLNTLKPLQIDQAEGGYQRPLSQLRVQDLTERFDAGEAREIYVSQREDGSRWILDGQHTWATLLNVQISDWPCRVFFNLSPAEEARRFAEYNNNTRRVPPVVQYNAEVLAGDSTAIALEKILSSYHLRISSSKLRSKEGYLGVASRAVFQKIFELGGQKLLEETLQVSIDAFGQNPNAFLGRMLQGVGYLLHYAEGEFDRKRMLAILSNTTPRQIVEAVGATGSGGASRRGADHILDLYINGVGAEFPALRRNAKETPKLPRTTPKAVEPHEYWTEETAAFGRKSIGVYTPPTPAPKAVKPKASKASKDAQTEGQAPEGQEVSSEPGEPLGEGEVDLTLGEAVEAQEASGDAPTDDADVDFDALDSEEGSTSSEASSDGWEYEAPDGPAAGGSEEASA